MKVSVLYLQAIMLLVVGVLYGYTVARTQTATVPLPVQPDGNGCMMTLTGPRLAAPPQWNPVNPSDPTCKP